jgi:hypothetical protein
MTCAAAEPNHYAVVTFDGAGQEAHGWDYRTLEVAKLFADTLRQEALRVEIWARDEFGKRLARHLPRPGNEWLVLQDADEGPKIPPEFFH